MTRLVKRTHGLQKHRDLDETSLCLALLEQPQELAVAAFTNVFFFLFVVPQS